LSKHRCWSRERWSRKRNFSHAQFEAVEKRLLLLAETVCNFLLAWWVLWISLPFSLDFADV
jgi:hypothetical protein